MLLSYLVTGRARRRLLRLIWAAGARGSVSELARRAGVSFASAHRELEAMRAERLAVAERAGAALVYRANDSYEQADVVRQLLDGGSARSAAPATERDRVRGWLAAVGAPLLVRRRLTGRRPSLEDVLAEGLSLSHRDAAVAGVMPVVLWKNRHQLDYGRLVRAAAERDEGQALGFLLEVTGLLGRDPRLASLARRLRDHRRARLRPYFARAQGRMAQALARRRTPPLARRWGYLMNMDLDSFASAFGKHGEGGAAAAIAYGVALGTRDVDTWTQVGEDLASAAERARQATGLAVPLARSGVADGPHDFESRLERTMPRLRRLKVMVPERHDLVLMKVVRGDERDLEAIEAVHQRSPLDLSTLVERYREEMGATVVDPGRLRGQFLTMVERLFPEDLDRVERQLVGRRG